MVGVGSPPRGGVPHLAPSQPTQNLEEPTGTTGVIDILLILSIHVAYGLRMPDTGTLKAGPARQGLFFPSR